MAKRFSLVPFLPLSLPLASSCLVPLCLVLLVLLAPKTPAQLLPPTTSWQPPAMIPAQVNPPEVIDVVASSVITLSGPTILDTDTVNGQQVPDNDWTYALNTGDAGTIVASDTSLAGDPPYFAWQAPPTACVVNMTMTAWDVGNSPTCDPATGTWTYEVHVHELAVYTVQGGLPFWLSTNYGDWISPPFLFRAVDNPWDNHTSTKHPTLSYSANPNHQASGWLLLEGGGTRSMQVQLCVKGNPTQWVDVRDTTVVLEIPWTSEGVTFTSASVPLTALPSGAITVTSGTALNKTVSFEEAPNWQWKAKVPGTPPAAGTQRTATLTPPGLEWVATSYGTLDKWGAGDNDMRKQVTADRVESVYEYLHGCSTIAGAGGIALKAGQWAVSGCNYDGAIGWAQMLYPDAWHQKSIQWYQCDSGAALAVEACRLVGVLVNPASDVCRIWPQSTWSPWGSWVSWSDVGDNCWATPTPHPAKRVYFRGTSTGALHLFQGIYRIDDGSGTARFYVVYPTPAEYDTLQQLVLACFPSPTFACWADLNLNKCMDEWEIVNSDTATHDLTPQ
jgi:hypothetical protein